MRCGLSLAAHWAGCKAARPPLELAHVLGRDKALEILKGRFI